MPINSASVKLLEPVLQLAKHYPQQHDTSLSEQILSCAALDEAEFSKPGARFAAGHYAEILQLLTSASGNPRIALSLGEATQPRTLGSVGFLMTSADTLVDAYQAFSDYLPLLFEGAVLQLEHSAAGSQLSIELNDNQPRVIEYFLACLANWPRWLSGHQVAVRAVNLTLPEPEDIQPYQQFFAAEVNFGAARNQVLLNSDYLNLSCLDANPEMHQLHREFADTLLSQTDQQGALIARTRNLIRQQLAEGGGSVRREQIASGVGLSLRTLQRKLGVLNTSFQEIYDQTRRELCLQLIQRGQLSFGEITYQLGFANQSAFQKAFKRWMNMAPSAYRQQIKPQLPQAPDIHQPTRPADDWLSAADRPQQLRQRMSGLTSFTRQLLDQAVVIGMDFSLSELAKTTADPIARLAIHLWPAEQNGLLLRRDLQGQQHYQFADESLQQQLYSQLTHEEQLSLHQRYASMLLAELPDNPALSSLSRLLTHLSHADLQHQPPAQQQRCELNLQAAKLSRQEQNYSLAASYTAQACTDSQDADTCQQLRLDSAELWLADGKTSAAAEQLQAFRKNADTGHVSLQHRYSLLSSRLLQQKGKLNDALQLLLDHYNRHADPLPRQSAAQLSLLLSQLETIQQQTDQPAATLQPVATLPCLETISLLARQLSQPLLAACAIGQLTLHCIQQPESTYSAFAFSSYAWVASWFCADTELARQFAGQARQQLAGQIHGQAGDSSGKQLQTAQQAALLLNSQVEHWYAPLKEISQQLSALQQHCADTSQWQTLSDCQLLQAQYSLFSHTPLQEQQQQLTQQHQQMLSNQQLTQAEQLASSALALTAWLQGEQPLPLQAEYQHGWQAVSTIIGALLLDQQHLWPQLLTWEHRLENELPGFYPVAEVLFCTALMRFIQAGQQTLEPRQKLATEQLISRLEIWSQHCPVNFRCQWLLLQAEQARQNAQPASQLYEQALQAASEQDFSFHHALVLERYASYLKQNEQPALAGFCLQQASDFYDLWGATARVKQLAQQVQLLAK